MQDPMAANVVPVAAEGTDHRTRLVEGMLASLAEKGYAETTVADVVRNARVSRRTFYEHFSDKRACFFAAYASIAAALLERILSATPSSLPPEAQLETATAAYIEALEERPGITRTFLVDVQGAGVEALSLRRQIHERFAELIRTRVDRAREARPDVRPLSREMALALVAGINELVLLSIEERGAESLSGVAETAKELLRAVVLTREP